MIWSLAWMLLPRRKPQLLGNTNTSIYIFIPTTSWWSLLALISNWAKITEIMEASRWLFFFFIISEEERRRKYLEVRDEKLFYSATERDIAFCSDAMGRNRYNVFHQNFESGAFWWYHGIDEREARICYHKIQLAFFDVILCTTMLEGARKQYTTKYLF